jgi:peptidoglycan/xylan/chitin deacetylase (PgdA/CDA1 family)
MAKSKQYYSRLEDYREIFTRGLPVLTYHKVEKPGRGVKLKGICVTPDFFARQMAELAADGFTTAGLDSAAEVKGNREKRIVLTFDDGYVSALENAAPVLREHRFSAIQFLVADFIGKRNEWDIAHGEQPAPLMDAVQVREWIAVGNEIGSHTLTHPHLHQLAREKQRTEIFDSKKKLEDLFGVPIRHFCYPYGDWNESIANLVLEAGYATACTTDCGINMTATPRGALLRINARYPSRNFRTLAKDIKRLIGF